MNIIKDRRGLLLALVLTAGGFGLASVSTEANAWHRDGYHGGGGWHNTGYYGHGYNRGYGGWGYGGYRGYRGYGSGWGVVIAPGVGYYGASNCGWVPAHRNINGRWIRAHRSCW
ncbi:MAG: hypothetical protein Q8R24_08180 [Legionellaceae bacterium]|nr:hypothetical protein [Legionellaceae bacterium]